jgi:hypothetical protein
MLSNYIPIYDYTHNRPLCMTFDEAFDEPAPPQVAHSSPLRGTGIPRRGIGADLNQGFPELGVIQGIVIILDVEGLAQVAKADLVSAAE